jgi:hypothetical protein
LVEESDHKGKWLDILDRLTVVDNKLYVCGNHGQLMEITHDKLIDEFIMIHLEDGGNVKTLPKNSYMCQ